MESEVCSIYLLRDNKLELFATHGLRKEAVHVTRLGMARACRHDRRRRADSQPCSKRRNIPPAYRPETGEERYHSFAGVPIVRLESPIGVLAVQHADPRGYEDVEIEALQTVAMVLSEMIAAARLVDGARRSRLRSAGPSVWAASSSLPGWRAAKRSSTSRAWWWSTWSQRTPRQSAIVYSAFRKMREQIDAMTKEAEFGTAGEHQEILETYKMFAYDEGWSRRINEAIDSGLTAEAAIERVQQRTRARMQDIDDPLQGPDARPGGSVQPAAAHRVRALRDGGADWPGAGHGSHRPQPRPGRTARI